jgi:hypothetical protein
MDHTMRPDFGPPDEEGRMARSWRLIGVAWRLLRGDRAMLTMAALGAVLALIATAVIFWFGGFFEHGRLSPSRAALVSLICAWPFTFASVFLNVGLAAAANAAVDGRRLGVGAALAVARRRALDIALWSLLDAGVGQLLSQIAERVPFGGRVLTWLIGAPWGVLTIFAVPVIAIEGCRAPGCLRRSAELVRTRWGEGLAGTVAITAVAGVASVVPVLFLCVGAGMAPFEPTAGIAVAAVGLAGLMVVIGASSAVREVFAVALYRYAADGQVSGGFPDSDLSDPFTKKKS